MYPSVIDGSPDQTLIKFVFYFVGQCQKFSESIRPRKMERLKFEVYLKLNIPEHSCLRWWHLSLFELHEADEADFLT